jgi:D-alanyl-D-alanine dipeptidase
MSFIKFKWIVFFPFLYSCLPDRQFTIHSKSIDVISKGSISESNLDTSDFEKHLISKGLINVSSIDSSIRVALHYSTKSNFLNKEIYPHFNACFLPPDIAYKLTKAQEFLKSAYPDYSIIVFDAARPLSIQKKMWDELDLPIHEKAKYLSNPHEISLHNYAAAVDVGIIGNNGLLLDMGSEFDFFGEMSEPKQERKLYLEGKLTKTVIRNRLLLREIMTKAGFLSITSEWWHFNSCSREFAKLNYQLIE